MTNYEQFIEILRLVDALLAALVFCLLVNRGTRYWSRYDNGQRWMYASFVTYVAAVCYTSFELYVQEVDTGLRSYAVLVANAVALFALWRYRKSIVLGHAGNGNT